MEVVYFAGGCLWGVQAFIKTLPGVKFTDMLNAAINKYNKRAIETSKVIEELIALAKEMNDSYKAGEASGLIKEEVAFYDALTSHDTADQVLGETS